MMKEQWNDCVSYIHDKYRKVWQEHMLEGNNILIFMGIIVLLVIVATVIAVVSSVAGAAAAIVDDEDGEENAWQFLQNSIR